jgi:hypothetical protein
LGQLYALARMIGSGNLKKSRLINIEVSLYPRRNQALFNII